MGFNCALEFEYAKYVHIQKYDYSTTTYEMKMRPKCIYFLNNFLLFGSIFFYTLKGAMCRI